MHADVVAFVVYVFDESLCFVLVWYFACMRACVYMCVGGWWYPINSNLHLNRFLFACEDFFFVYFNVVVVECMVVYTQVHTQSQPFA